MNSYGNAFSDSYKIAGLFNNWGAIKDTIFNNGVLDRIPMIAFHGIDDIVVPFSKGYFLSCKDYDVNYGSNLMYSRIKNSYPDLPVEVYACYGGHGILDGDPKTDPTSLYRVQKAVCFFNRLRNGDTSKFNLQINQNEADISYSELDSLSPVNCTFTQACQAPSGLAINNVTINTATLTWTAVANAVKYKIQYRVSGSTWNAITVIAPASSYMLTGLQGLTSYQWRVATISKTNPQVISAYGAIKSFATTNDSVSFASVTELNNDAVFATQHNGLIVFPNPVATQATLEVNIPVGEFEINITDIQGKTFWRKNNLSQPKIDLPVQNLAPGIYFVRITNKRFTGVVKFAKTK